MTPIKLALKFFRDEIESVIRDKYDPTHTLPGFIEYHVRSQLDPNLPEALDICPTGAVYEDNGVYGIEDALCIRCNACREVAPGGIEVRDRFPIEVAEAATAAG
jgi:NAD-dependent dihydropyrimidine dehydrogenase PreA subunit